MGKEIEKEIGITLIALILTIIVLLILAGVAISLFRDEGIIEKGNQAQTATRIAQEKELASELMLEAKLEKMFDDETTEKTVIPEDIEEMVERITDEEITVTQDEGNNIRIKYEDTGREYIVDQGGTVIEIDQELLQGSIQWGTINWSNGIANITATATVQGYAIQYKKGNDEWTTVEDTEIVQITDIPNNTEVKARLWDGMTGGQHASLLIKDTTPPTVEVTITGKTTNSITARVTASDGQTGMVASPTYTFYVKETSEGDGTYTQVQTGTGTTATATGLKQDTNYTIKVVTKDIGEVEGSGTDEETTGTVESGLVTGNITWGTVTWSGGKASVTVTPKAGYYIQYQVGGTSGTWTPGTTAGGAVTISEITNGQTVYVRLADGTGANANVGQHATLLIEDTTAPVITTTTASFNSISITAIEEASGIIGYKITTTSTQPTSFDTTTSTLSFTKNFTGLTQNTEYWIWIKDAAGNVSEGEKIITKKESEVLGLYNSSDELIASWDELEDLGLDITQNYTGYNKPGTMYYLLKNNTELKENGVKLIIPTSVTSIGDFAFTGCTALTSITIPTNVTSIGDSAFSGCTALTSMVIPSKVTKIGEKTFYNCSSLTSITIPTSVTSIETYAFYRCINLTRITIPTSVTSIGMYAFQNCSALTSITIPTSVTSIGNYVFSGCSSLTRITIPTSVTSIGNSAFSGCSSLTSITIPTSVTSIGTSAFSGCSKLTSITIPEGVTSIGNSAFSGCSSLTSITIPTSVTSIGTSAFSQCTVLTNITIPEGVTSIGNSAFFKCYKLTNVTIPSSVTSIGTSAFQNCHGLKSITILGGITSIEASTFKECISLTSITLPEGVTSIGASAFYGCKVLTSITIPTSVTSIGSSAFYGCYVLSRITIPEGVTSIGENAFIATHKLYYVIIDSSTIASGLTERSSFGNLVYNATIVYIKSGLTVDTYITTNYTEAATQDKTGYVKYTNTTT